MGKVYHERYITELLLFLAGIFGATVRFIQLWKVLVTLSITEMSRQERPLCF